MRTETDASIRAMLAAAVDNDGLVGNMFEEIEQDWVRIGQFWVRLDRRLSWQLAQCFRQNPALLPGLRLRLDPSEVESLDQHGSPIRKAYWWGARFRWDQLGSYRGPVETVHADPASQIQQLNFVAQARFRWNFPKDEHIGVLQIEEFRDSPETPADSFTTKYLHSIVDLGERTFKHLDGAIKGEAIRYVERGRSEAYGTSQFSDATVLALTDLVQQSEGGIRVNSIFGEGQSPKLRKIREGLEALHFPADRMLQHGRGRMVYCIPLVRNLRDFLLGIDPKPEYLAPIDVEVTTRIADWWKERWFRHRTESPDVMTQVEQHTKVYPIRHGARVTLPKQTTERGNVIDLEE